MNDAQRITLGLIGTASAWTLDHFAKLAAIAASLATAAFMVASLIEKIRNLRKK